MDEVRIELDACEPQELPLRVGISLELLHTKGPSGWPIVLVAGARDAVREYVREHWDDDTAACYDELYDLHVLVLFDRVVAAGYLDALKIVADQLGGLILPAPITKLERLFTIHDEELADALYGRKAAV